MVIFIGGPTHSGKTLLSQNLLEKFKIPYFSIDHLKMGLYRGMKNCNFTPLDNFYVLGKKIWPILKSITMTNIENKQNIIIEGAYLLPKLITDFESKYLKEIITIFITFSDKYIRKNFKSFIIKYRNSIELRKYENDYTIEKLINEHHQIKNDCIENQISFFEINDDYKSEIDKIYNYLARELKTRKSFSTSSPTTSYNQTVE